MTIGDRIKLKRKEKGLTLEEVADFVGISRQNMSRYETGVIKSIPSDKIELIATVLNTVPSYLMGWGDEPDPDIFSPPNILPMPKTKKVPRLGAIACGDPALAIEEADEFDEAPVDIDCDFTLICKGDSMINARIYDGDVVYVRSQPDVENGQIAAVIIDDEALLKRVYKHPGQIVLAPENPAFRSIIVTGPQLNDVRILGLAVWFRSRVR